MDDLGLLHPGVLMAHAVWITDDDIARTGAAGVSVSCNATSKLKFGSGLCPVRKLPAAGVNVGPGTDGAASNDTMCEFDVMRVAQLAQTLNGPAPDAWLLVGEVLTAATIGGARTTLLGHKTGLVACGKKADRTFLGTRHATSFTPWSDPVRQLVQ